MAGVSVIDRKLASDVRSLTLRQIKKVLEDESDANKDYKRQLILKLASTVLPRINEHSGPDGGEMKFSPIYGGLSTTYTIDSDTIPVGNQTITIKNDQTPLL